MQDEAEPLTRLGVRDHMAEFQEPFAGPFGQPVDRLAIPGWLMPQEETMSLPIVLEHSPGITRFRLGTAIYRYDRYGLQKEKA
jgi:hypothetical protein